MGTLVALSGSETAIAIHEDPRSYHPRAVVALTKVWAKYMGRLRSLRPRLAPAGARIAVLVREDLERARDATRDREIATRPLYKTARWQRLRLTILAQDLYTCRICRRIEGNSSRLVCDHILPHRGDVEKFWAGPFQTLCKRCHDSDKQRFERARKVQA